MTQANESGLLSAPAISATPSDEELIKRFQGGDRSAFDQLVQRFKIPLMNYISRIVRDQVFAEDLLQETFLRLWINRDSYREIARFSTWIYTVAGNLAKTELRKRKIRRWIPISGGEYEEGSVEPADPVANPLQDLEQSNAHKHIYEEIDRLPKIFKDVITLRDVQELSYEEIGIILKIPIGTVKSRVNRGRLRLQKRLKDLL